MEVVLTIILFFLTIWGIRMLGERIQNKHSQIIVAEYEEKQRQRDIERERDYDLVAPLVENFYSSILTERKTSNNMFSVKVIRAKTANDLEKVKEILPDEWTSCADDCECWVKDDVLYILLPKSQALVNAHNTPTAYNTEEKICSAVPHWVIPFGNIHYYKVVGNVFHTKKVVGGGNVSYTGVSVNGIGFGELKHDPVITMSEINDSRYVVLYYRDNAESPLQTVYFCYDSLDTLIRLIPQFEK